MTLLNDGMVTVIIIIIFRYSNFRWLTWKWSGFCLVNINTVVWTVACQNKLLVFDAHRCHIWLFIFANCSNAPINGLHQDGGAGAGSWATQGEIWHFQVFKCQFPHPWVSIIHVSQITTPGDHRSSIVCSIQVIWWRNKEAWAQKF